MSGFVLVIDGQKKMGVEMEGSKGVENKEMVGYWNIESTNSGIRESSQNIMGVVESGG